MRNSELYDSTAARCKKRALQFDISVMAKKYNDRYCRLLKLK